MKLTPAIALSTAILMSNVLCHASAWAAPSKQRWFDIEVILFQQLSDKTQLQEAFIDNAALPSDAKAWDILTPHFNPDIASLKQQLADCGSDALQSSLAQQGIAAFVTEQVLHQQKSLAQIDATAVVTPVVTPPFDDQYYDDFSGPKPLPAEQVIEPDVAQLVPSTLAPAQEQQVLTPELALLLVQAEQAFAPIKFNYTQDFRLFSANPSQKGVKDQPLCRLPPTFFSPEQRNNPEFSYNGFTIEQVTKTLDGSQVHGNKSAYLLAKKSLRLSNIMTQLRRSKDFKPLLHLGWRQSTLPRGRATPMRLYAGDNLNLHYKNALVQYQADSAKLLQQEPALLTALPTAADKPPERQNSVDERINQILNQVEQLNISEQSLIAQLDQPLPDLAESTPLAKNPELMLANAPQPPLQDWLLEGLFKVHVDHYLHITADFNILNMSLAQQATRALNPQNTSKLQTIRFAQDRRVISGEIHYFDHPYVGMIVQIRPYKMPKPAVDQPD